MELYFASENIVLEAYILCPSAKTKIIFYLFIYMYIYTTNSQMKDF